MGFLIAVVCTGCHAEVPASDGDADTSTSALASHFDPASTGGITGRVTWKGTIPEPSTFMYCLPRPDGKGLTYIHSENPNRPRIDPATRAISGAVVFLRGIDPTQSRPWDLPPVAIEMGNGKITVVQGDRRDRVGFLRRGDPFTAKSIEPLFHILRGRGDAYFSQTLPEPGASVSRTLHKAGRVELSSGTGLYWARGDLFVADHPYYTVTGTDGRFILDRVPAGDFELVVWLPGWGIAKQERNPDTTAISSMTYTPALERISKIAAKPGQVSELEITLHD